jgi:hypothetical protein
MDSEKECQPKQDGASLIGGVPEEENGCLLEWIVHEDPFCSI